MTTVGWANYSMTYHWLHLSLQTGTSYITRLATCPLIWVGSDWRKGKWWFEDRRWVRLIWPGLELKYLMGDPDHRWCPVGGDSQQVVQHGIQIRLIHYTEHSLFAPPTIFICCHFSSNKPLLRSGRSGNVSERRAYLRKFLSIFEPENIGEKWFWN